MNNWRKGDWYAACQVCGFKFYASQLRKRWDGLRVDDACYETRHPQEFARGVKESVVPWTRPELDGIDISPAYPTWLEPTPLTNLNTFYSPTVVPGTVTLSQDTMFSNTNTFYAAEVILITQFLEATLFSNTNSFYAPTVELMLQFLTPDLFSNTNSFYAATVTPGTITLTPGLFSNTNTFYGPTVSGASTIEASIGFDNVQYHDQGINTDGAATLTINSDGTWTVVASSGTPTSGDWLDPTGTGVGAGWYGELSNFTFNTNATYPAGIFEFSSNRQIQVTGGYSSAGSLVCSLKFSQEPDMSVIAKTVTVKLSAEYVEV